MSGKKIVDIGPLTSQTSSDSVLDLAINSAEHAFEQMRLSRDAAAKKDWALKAQAYLRDAELIKNNGAKSVASPMPTVTRILPKSEQILLLKASYVNGIKYPPWTTSPDPTLFQLTHEGPYCDDAVYSLSKSQQQVFAGWQRPQEALSAPTMVHDNPIDLVQDASTDCSVVASLCAGVARQKRGHAKLTSSVIHPWDTKTGYPSMSLNGKYIIRLNFNGCFRRVAIDDRLPTSSTERFIHVFDRQNPNLLWPALVEKAYLKVRGGYDFPGSNSATDLWTITGWIPEQAFLQASDLDMNELWSRMWKDWHAGDVLITMGTGKMSAKVEQEVGLAGEHDYAVLDLREIDGQRLLLLKNPWCEGTNWHRVPQRKSEVDLTAIGKSVELQSNAQDASQLPRDLLNADSQLSSGTFWIDLNNAAQYFESIYLNWNPGRFAYRQDLHFAWDLADLSASRGAHGSLRRQPQFSICAASGGPVWVLLCRHLDKTNETATTSSDVDLNGFISLSAYAAGGKRVHLTGKIVDKSNIVDSPQILLKLDGCAPGVAYTVVAAEQELPSKYHTFTISAFSSSELALEYALPRYPFTSTLTAAWTRDTAGGNVNSPTYGTNPQFSINISRKSKICILLEADQDMLNVHVKLVHSDGKRIRSVRNRDVVVDSGDYRRRCCVAESKIDLEAGLYTVICSTFEPHQLGTFNLLIEADRHIDATPLPRDGAGRLSEKFSPAFPAESTKIAAKLTPGRLVNFYAIAKIPDARTGSGPQLELSIEQGQASQRRIITSSTDADEQALGPARLEELDLNPATLKYGQLWLVLTRVCVAERALLQAVDLEVFTDQADAITIGKWINVDD